MALVKSDPSAKYIHRSLEHPQKQIRLLRCIKTSPDYADEMWLWLSTWTAEEAPEYKAISYTWGNGADLSTIQVNGKPFPVRQNCHYALWQAWLHFPNDFIWIDSICINQDDVEEKSVQVQNMAGIYATANTVLICIGSHSDFSDCLVECVQELECRMVPPVSTHEDVLDRSILISGFTRLIARQDGRDYKTIFGKFSGRPYWSRLWAVQEVAMAKTKIVHCGNHMLPWWFVQISARDHRNYLVSKSFQNLVTKTLPQKLSLLKAITHFKEFQCFDVRDRFYGILGLIDWENEPATEFTVDYTLTSFGLLLRILNHLEEFQFHAVVNVMDLFGFTAASTDMQQLIEYIRHRNEDRGHSVGYILSLKDSCYVQKRVYWGTTLCRVRQSPNGHLIANFFDVKSYRSMSPATRWQLDLNLANTGIPNGSRQVYSAGALCALLCAEAKEGDIILSSSRSGSQPGSVHERYILLVLRRLGGEEYSIVGQGLTVGTFYPSADKQYCDMRMEMRLTALEAVILFGQDHLGCDSRGYVTRDSHALLKRLDTPIILDQVPTARARLVRRDSSIN